MTARRKHSKEFKLEAIRLATQPGASVKDTAKNLGIHPSQIHDWKHSLKVDGDEAFRGNGVLRDADEEIRQLKLELKRVRAERDILKKATIFFATEGVQK